MALGLISFFLGDKPTSKGHALNLSFNEFDEIIQAPVDQISALELADYLIKQQHHYNLIDLQGSEASYHIPTAESFTATEFLQSGVAVNETIILYSEHEIKATQLYYLLVIRGYFNVKVLSGGLNQWTQQVLQPNLINIPIEQKPLRQKITDFFGGSFSEIETSEPIKVIKLDKKIKQHHGC